jgi:pimeloyl-ACP methyl ester carboxylesterase
VLTGLEALKSRIVNPDSLADPLIVCIHGGGCTAEYFDVPGFSFCDRAVARGYSLLLVNRPGHGGSPRNDNYNLCSSAGHILGHVQNVLRKRRSQNWVAVGHSIGAAVVTVIASKLPRGLLGIALSGIGDRPTQAARTWARGFECGQPDAVLAQNLLFGPPGTFSWRGAKALRPVLADWRSDEVEETLYKWPSVFAERAPQVAVPVHLRLADMERIWDTGHEAVARLARAFASAPAVDAGLLRDGGHLYEIHNRGAELGESQLDFFDELSSRLDLEAPAGLATRP